MTGSIPVFVHTRTLGGRGPLSSLCHCEGQKRRGTWPFDASLGQPTASDLEPSPFCQWRGTSNTSMALYPHLHALT